MAAKDDYLLENLVDLGYVTRGQVEAAGPEAEASGLGVVDLMLEQKLISSTILTQAKAAHFGFEVVNLAEMRLDDELISSVPRNIAKRYR
ncbi:MAG: type II secretion system protein E, partial [Verrucomicrobia bacterium]